MKQQDKPLWQQLYSPTSYEELTELRQALATSPKMSAQLQAFLHAEVLVKTAQARRELTPEMRLEYQHTANAFTELLGMLFQPEKMTTERRRSL
ncbi:hypothetical protein A1D22_05790 [Pasteurellaceae bacterium LFhippo2]|nr:hypothetical protein [Pasteurellaceae bacterium LFhippo2]